MVATAPALFCAIPLIKGPLVSRTRESIIRDALFLQNAGVKEINLIAQDVTAYGADRGESDALADLLTVFAASDSGRPMGAPAFIPTRAWLLSG